MCVSRVWREAGKEKASFPKELDFTTVPNLSEVGYGDIMGFMYRIEGVVIKTYPEGDELYEYDLRVRDGFELDRMRLVGCPLAGWEVELCDFYVKHDRRKVKAFDKGPFDLWFCEECDMCAPALDDKSKARVCVSCEGVNTCVYCEECAPFSNGHSICEFCDAWRCGKHDEEDPDEIEDYCHTCDKDICLNCVFEECKAFHCVACGDITCVRALFLARK